LTPRGSPAFFAFVHRFRRIFALLLLAAWLPATLHCGLEAAGLHLGPECCAGASHAEATSGCESDDCEILEGGFTPSSSLHVTAPAIAVCACLLHAESQPPMVAVFSPPASGIDDAAAPPRELVPSWPFVSRAALSPRAPSLAS
jgi:hypothetical protein